LRALTDLAATVLTPDVVAAVGRLHLEALPVLSVVTAGLLVEPLGDDLSLVRCLIVQMTASPQIVFSEVSPNAPSIRHEKMRN
jgi:hypothetical protein